MKTETKRPVGAPRGARNGKPKRHVNIKTDFDIVDKFKANAALLDPRRGQKMLFDEFVATLPEVKG